MNKLDSQKILKSLPSNYYVIDCNTLEITESNDPNLILQNTKCYNHIFGFNKPCDQIDAHTTCTCKKVKNTKEKLDIVQNISTFKGDAAHKVIASPVTDSNNEVTHIIAHYINISNELNLECEFAKQNIELQVQNEEYEAVNEKLKVQKEEFETLYTQLKESNYNLEKSKNEVIGLKDFFENINESIQDGIWVTDKNDVIFYSNPAMEKIAGISRMDIINKNVLKDFPKETIKELIPFFIKAKSSLKPAWYEIKVKTPSGNDTYQNVWLNPLLKRDEYNGMICTIRDVTDRFLTQKELIKSEENFRLLFENMQEAFALHEIILDKKNIPIDYRFVDINPEFEKQTGLKRSQIINRTVLEVLPATEKKWIAKYGKVAVTGEAIQFEDFSSELKKTYIVIAYSPKKNYFATIFRDITKQKSTEQRLLKNQLALQKIINITGDSSKQEYFSSMVLALNDVFSADYVYIGKLIKKNQIETISVSYQGKLIDNIIYGLDNAPCEKVIDKNTCLYSENVSQKFPNDELLKELNISGYVGVPLLNKKGDVIGILVALFHDRIRDEHFMRSICEVFARNIGTELERTYAEIALKESEQKFKSYIQNAPYGIIVANEKGEYIEVNPVACKITGYTENELLKLTVSDLIQYDYLPQAQQHFEKCIKSGYANGQIGFKTKKGESRFWNVEAVKLSAKRVLGFVTDTTEGYKSRLALQESEQKFKVLSESSPMSVMMFQEDKWVYINPMAEKVTGYSIKELANMNFWDFIHPDYVNIVKERGRARQSGDNAPYNYDFKIITKNGTEKWVSLYGASITFSGKSAAILSVLDITELKTVELALKDSEQKLRNITENSTNMFYQHTVDHQLTFLSPQVKNILGYTVDEALIKWTELLTDNPINLVGLKITEKAIKTGEVQLPYQLELKHKSGRNIWVEVREAPLIEKGEVTGIVGAITDITKRKLANIALKESEERYRKLFESANVGIGISTINGNIVAANDALTKMFKYSQNDLLNTNIKKLYENLDDRETLLNAVKTKGGIRNFQIQMKSKKSVSLWVHISAQRFSDSNDDRILFVISDITKEKEAEIEIRKQESKFKKYIESSPLAIFIVNEKGEYIYANSAVTKLIGYTNQEILKLSIPDIKIVSDTKDALNYFFELKEKGQVTGTEIKYRAKNGEAISVIIDAIRLDDKQYIAFCTDVSELKIVENELKQRNEEYLSLNSEMEEYISKLQDMNKELQKAKLRAEESDRLKSAFLANMSHELRTPLNGILGFSALMHKAGLPKETMLRYSQIIETSGKRLLNVVNDLFDISLIHSDQLKIEKDEFRINELLDEIDTFYHTIKKDKLQSISLKLIKSSEIEINLTNDKYRLHQIFKNLLDNAFKFTDKGQIEFGYQIKEKHKITFFVKDSGIGISKEYQKMIFTSFKQVDDSITRDYEGAGLGLAICGGLLERMGGKIWVESEKTKGSQFYFDLPLNNGYEKTKDENYLQEIKKTLLKDKMILIVEDDIVSYEFLKIYLENIGGSGIIQTANGEDAVKIVESGKVDLIFMDIRLPGIDGYETTRRIRIGDKKVKIIAQTAYALENDKEKSIAAGCNDHISKPIDEKGLIEIIQKYFG